MPDEKRKLRTLFELFVSGEDMAITDERTFRKALSAAIQEFGDGIMAEWRKRHAVRE